MKKIQPIQLSSNNILNWLLQNKTKSIEHEPVFVKNNFALHLKNSFDKITKSNKVEKLFLNNFFEKDYKDTSMDAVLDVQSLIKDTDYFSNFIIHSSTSDLKIINGWSDFDAIAVVKDTSLNSKTFNEFFNLCVDIDNKMRDIDSLQHHGIHFIHENELLAYPQLYLPKEILQKGKCLLGSRTITLGSINSYDNEMERFYSIVKIIQTAHETGFLNHHALNNKFLKENYEDENTMYQLKYYLCVLMLLPSFWLNLKGNYCQKSESFSIIQQHFSKNDLEILEKASTVRKNWKNISVNDNKIPKWVMKILGPDYFQRGSAYANCLLGEI